MNIFRTLTKRQCVPILPPSGFEKGRFRTVPIRKARAAFAEIREQRARTGAKAGSKIACLAPTSTERAEREAGDVPIRPSGSRTRERLQLPGPR